MALQAAQTAAIGLQFQVAAARWADEDLKQVRTDGHSIENTSLALSPCHNLESVDRAAYHLGLKDHFKVGQFSAFVDPE
jgi:hypothetical protein